MSNEPSDKPNDVEPAEDAPADEERECDALPDFIDDMLENFELLPHEARADFMGIYESLESLDPRTTHEFILMAESTKLIWNIRRLERFEAAILINQRPAAAESFFRKLDGLRAPLTVGKYFLDPDFKEKSDNELEAIGYDREAIEAEAYLRAMPSLAVIHRQKAADRKTLIGLLKELNFLISSRNRNKKVRR